MSFIPGDLYLTEETSGFFTVTFQGAIVLKSKTKKMAIAKYDAIRNELQVQFPARDVTPEEKKELLRKASLDSMVPHNSLRSELKKKPGRTRTFGD